MHFWGLFKQVEAQPQSNGWALVGFNLEVGNIRQIFY